MLDKSEVITCKNWQSLCDYIYDVPDFTLPEGNSIVWVCMDNIFKFFEEIRGTGRRYIVISSYSDFGICNQFEYPVAHDLVRYLKFLTSKHNVGYNGFQVSPRCDLTQCKYTDKYAVRCYNWTKCTFPVIPDEIMYWFTTNCMVQDHPKIQGIPFGVAENMEEVFANLDPTPWDKRDKLLYVNFNDHTAERIELKNFFRHYDWATVVDEFKPHDEYLTDLMSHQFVLCPEGNGLDCYRTLEAIYTGTVPILQSDNRLNTVYGSCAKYTEDFKYLSHQNWPTLINWYQLIDMHSQYKDRKGISTLSYWRKQINEKRALL